MNVWKRRDGLWVEVKERKMNCLQCGEEVDKNASGFCEECFHSSFDGLGVQRKRVVLKRMERGGFD